MTFTCVNIHIFSYCLNIFKGYLTIWTKIIIYWGAYSIKSETHGNSYSPPGCLKSVSSIGYLTDNLLAIKLQDNDPECRTCVQILK